MPVHTSKTPPEQSKPLPKLHHPLQCLTIPRHPSPSLTIPYPRKYRSRPAWPPALPIFHCKNRWGGLRDFITISNLSTTKNQPNNQNQHPLPPRITPTQCKRRRTHSPEELPERSIGRIPFELHPIFNIFLINRSCGAISGLSPT